MLSNDACRLECIRCYVRAWIVCLREISLRPTSLVQIVTTVVEGRRAWQVRRGPCSVDAAVVAR
jgi:hypothetical protein